MITTQSKWRQLHDQLRCETDKLLLQASIYYLKISTQNEFFEAISKKRKIEDERRVFNEQ